MDDKSQIIITLTEEQIAAELIKWFNKNESNKNKWNNSIVGRTLKSELNKWGNFKNGRRGKPNKKINELWKLSRNT